MAGLIIGIFALLQKLLCAPQQPQDQQQQQQQQAWQQQQQQYGPQGQWQGQQGYPPVQQPQPQQQWQQPQPQQQWPTPAQGQWQQGPPQPWQQVQQQHHSPPPGQHAPSPSPHLQAHHAQHSPSPHPQPNGDMQHASDAHYTSLRAQANAEGDQMGQCFDRAHEAHERGDGAAAKELSNEGHEHQRRMEQLNRQAADWIFQANNSSSPQGTIDLHGLYVQEAIDRTEEALQAAQGQGAPELRVIVGKGLHSAGHVAKIKPAIEQLMQKYSFSAELDPANEGVLIVHLGGAAQGRRGMDAEEVTRRLDNDEKCVIM
ncbi:DUF1771-domain-containing protein [Calocera viscosa TUFC12733]|uniref:DUF1771-domain-containing protein n=1 Tax=Calocera viscosa (strain TUFC12733) TaxID=1330018 RepID=A0A167PLJ5_CALVF|nr:DUF1771-domain-containing protein [Calocera viscosa TUFC12733]